MASGGAGTGRWRGRAAAAAAVIGSLALVTAACGGSSSKKTEAASSDTSAAPTTTVAPTTTTVDKQADATKAKQINLVAADLPSGFTSTPAKPQTAEDRADADKMRACLGLKPAADVETANVDSDDFHSANDDVEISSSVSFAVSADEARQEAAAYKSNKAAPCLKEGLNAVIARQSQGATVTNMSVTPVSAPAAGDDHFGFNVTATVSSGGQETTVVVELLGVLVGRAELSYTTLAVGDGTVPASVAQHALTSMVSRAGA